MANDNNNPTDSEVTLSPFFAGDSDDAAAGDAAAGDAAAGDAAAGDAAAGDSDVGTGTTGIGGDADDSTSDVGTTGDTDVGTGTTGIGGDADDATSDVASDTDTDTDVGTGTDPGFGFDADDATSDVASDTDTDTDTGGTDGGDVGTDAGGTTGGTGANPSITKTFTLSNNGNTTLNISGIVFTTPAGVTHSANLINFSGGNTTFTGGSFSTNTAMSAGSTKLFSVTYAYASGSPRTAAGTIVASTSQGASATSQINFNIV